MAIPKEPRQLMINLMYLVLTALLALNVSAEVMNAFKTIDDSLIKSNTITNSAIDEQQQGLADLLADESKAKFRPLNGAIKEIRAIVSEFTDYIENIKYELIDEAGDRDGNGNLDPEDYMYFDDPVKRIVAGKKNKDVTTRLMVEEGRGDTLEMKVAEVRKNIEEAYERVISEPENAKAFGFRTPAGDVDTAAVNRNIRAFKNNISLETDKDWEQKLQKGKKMLSWADFRFRQMPLISVLPLLTKFQTDAKNAEALAVGKMAELAGGREIVFNTFFPVINAKKAYVIKGESFEADISLGAYSSDIPPENITLTVNGSRLPVGDDGVAKFTAGTSSTGTKTLNLSATVKNPLTGEVSTEQSTFEYEVGVRSATVSADKMNVFYIGVDNPVSVTVAGVASFDVKVSASGCSIKASDKANGKYVVTSDRPGEAKINVSGGGLPNTPFDFRVKRIPDPVARLGNKPDGSMGNGEFKVQKGLIAWLDNFDFDAKCNIQGYILTRVAKRQDPVEATNKGGSFNDKAKRLVLQAKPGDTFYFDNVKARCPGDKAGRRINSLVYKIK